MALAHMAETQGPAAVLHLTPSEKFFKYFQQEVTALQEQIERISAHGSSGGERADAIDHCLAGIAHLSNEVHDAASSLPAYDQRTYGEGIKALSAKLQDVRSTVAPKPKFSFRSAPSFNVRKNASAISINDAAELASQKRRQVLPGYVSSDEVQSSESSLTTTPAYLRSPAPEPADGGETMPDQSTDKTKQQQKIDTDQADSLPLPIFSSSTSGQPSTAQSTIVQISSHENQHIILPRSSDLTSATTATLSNLSNCIINLSPPTTTPTSPTSPSNPFATLTLKNLQSSLLVCGPVAGAAHITNATSCTIIVSSRQFRMHGSTDCDVYLSTRSRPIIEDCRGIRFAALPETYGQWGGDGAKREGEERGGCWRDVDDFNWLKREASPNWRVLEDGERVREEVWRDVVPGGPGVGVGQILRAVGVGR